MTGRGEIYRKFEKDEEFLIQAIKGDCPYCDKPFKVVLNIEEDLGSS